ncbi:MAG: type II secretion system F family protein [Planctomycetia bacterium]|nr:type II secretion system F family protein [Planctomycetia bacterium]
MLQPPLILVSSVLLGIAVGLGLRIVMAGLGGRLQPEDRLTSFERARRQRMREASGFYARFETLLRELADRHQRKQTAQLLRLTRDLPAAESLPWLPEEYLAAQQIKSGLAALIVGAFALFLFENIIAAVVFGLLAAIGYQQLMNVQVSSRASSRLRQFKERLPFAIDLMALMMEAGAGFGDALKTVVRENQSHPLGRQFGEVLRETEFGRTRREALLALQQRMPDPDLAEFVFAVIKGEELGTPLSLILRGQADQMRLKRSQWAEKEAAEAQVMIVFPGMLIMIACLLIVVSPYILASLYGQ